MRPGAVAVSGGVSVLVCVDDEFELDAIVRQRLQRRQHPINHIVSEYSSATSSVETGVYRERRLGRTLAGLRGR